MKKTKKNKNKTVYPIKSAINAIKQFNLGIFIVIIVSGLIFAILLLTNIVNQPVDDNSQENNTSTSGPATIILDQTTVNQLNKLKTIDNNSGDSTLPSGRINPFSG